MICPNCGFDSPREMHFCGSCGSRLTVACAQCGFDNPLDYRFCGMCGTALVSDAAEAVLQPQQAAAEFEPLEPIPSTPALAGERRVISVIVTDLTDSTQLLENTDTESWVDLMNRILHVLESEIYRFGGEVGQFRGDGLVAFFGANVAHEDDPERAVLAALSMQRAFKTYVSELSQPEAKVLQMRVGVNTGEVIAAAGTDRHNWEESAMGTAVTIAARMETAAQPGTVLVSEFTQRLTESQFEWQPLGEIAVKGISQPLNVYRPVSHIIHIDFQSFGEELPDRLPRIGRDSEFHALKRCVEGLFDGRGRIATLSADKGSGKSFLINEVRQYFAHREALLAETQGVISTEHSLTWVRGRCRSYSATWPYSMWIDLLHNWLGIRPNESKEEKSTTLRLRSEALWGDRFLEHYPYLATLLAFPLEAEFREKIRHLDAERLRERYFLAVRSWVETASQRGPLVLAFSDIQWADDSSLALLKYCLPVCDNEAVLWMLSFRPERESSLWEFNHYLQVEYPHRLTSVDLPPLTTSECQELIDQIIGANTLPEETSHLIIRHAEGYPYYILELIRSLIASGVLRRENDESPWRLTRTVTTLDLPESLQSLLLSRIDRLSPQQRSVLQCAAVIGPVFWMNMLETILGGQETLRADIAALQREQLIEESGRIPELGMQYAFRSPLLRETVYESLLNTIRVSYHLRVAEFLENEVNPDVLGNYDGLLAYHYRMAGNLRKELFYTVLAAEHERKIYANAEALQNYNRAMELLDALESENGNSEKKHSIQTQRFEVLNGRRHVYFQLGQIQAGRADTEALLPLARQMADDSVWLIDALIAQADISRDDRQELIPGLQMAEEALALSQKLGDQYREMRSLIRIANAYTGLNNPAWKEMAERALSLARQFGDLRTEVSVLLNLVGRYGPDDLHRSREYLQTALSRSETLNDKAIKLSLLLAIGQQFERDGDYYRQLTEYEHERLRLSREIGDRIQEGSALMFCGQIQAVYLGDYETGLELELQALHLWENITDRLYPQLRIAQIQTALGRRSEALVTLELANPLGEKVVNDVGRVGLGLVTAILYNALGDEGHLQSALNITSQIQKMVSDNLVSRQYHMAAACENSLTHLNMARALTGSDSSEALRKLHLSQALESSQAALSLYQQFGFVQIVECTSEEILYRHSQALALNGSPAEALEYLERAYQEMLRKHDLIPADSPYRKTFLENIQLHKDIQTAYSTQNADSNPVI